MIETPTREQLLSHETQKTIDTAHLLFWQRTGRGQFRDAKHLARLIQLCESPSTAPEVREEAEQRIQALKEEIRREKLSTEEAAVCLTPFSAPDQQPDVPSELRRLRGARSQ